MAQFLMENAATIIGAGTIFGVVARIIYGQIRAHRNHEGGCSCGCSGCANSGICHPQPKDDHK